MLRLEKIAKPSKELKEEQGATKEVKEGKEVKLQTKPEVL